MNKSSDYFAHHTAVVDEGCTIGAGCKIWHFSHVMPQAVIGKNCNLGQNVFVAAHVRLGDGCKVQNNVSLYEGVMCEENVFIGPSAVFTNVINPRSHVSRKQEYKKTLLHHGVTIGANATIVCGVTIGAYAFVGAGAVITKDIPAYALYVGNPARQIGWMSQHGQRLEFGADNLATCVQSGMQYALKNNQVSIIE